ncbi:hypothetical protein RFI_16540 [Reticulomyxa filosa]|uniref:Uncharacterized protein n=1 Tax=Reticulomyxa filosa TaxID=46433 RepID=X6N5T8_RETFI|nr:hypothetical protein RFI_16540 [Reticulomyxa filosa]|eukprot:ETO20677.1 hypothetical protein RFI_16540 [Reticulomyxa filosa]
MPSSGDNIRPVIANHIIEMLQNECVAVPSHHTSHQHDSACPSGSAKLTICFGCSEASNNNSRHCSTVSSVSFPAVIKKEGNQSWLGLPIHTMLKAIESQTRNNPCCKEPTAISLTFNPNASGISGNDGGSASCTLQNSWEKDKAVAKTTDCQVSFVTKAEPEMPQSPIMADHAKRPIPESPDNQKIKKKMETNVSVYVRQEKQPQENIIDYGGEHKTASQVLHEYLVHVEKRLPDNNQPHCQQCEHGIWSKEEMFPPKLFQHIFQQEQYDNDANYEQQQSAQFNIRLILCVRMCANIFWFFFKKCFVNQWGKKKKTYFFFGKEGVTAIYVKNAIKCNDTLNLLKKIARSKLNKSNPSLTSFVYVIVAVMKMITTTITTKL